jgi:hypothetical protein
VQILRRRDIFTEPLPSNSMRGYTYRHTDCREGFMKYTVEIGSGAMIYIPSFVNFLLSIQKLITGTR